MKQLQEAAIKTLDDQGGYGKYFRWGTSHFLGMEVHDHGDNLIPFKPGICITVEPGLVMDEFTIVLEDDILCTEDGNEWLTQFIPREIEDIEKIMTENGIGKIFFQRQAKQYKDEFNKLIQLQKEVSGIHPSLQNFYPIALVENNFFYLWRKY